MNAEEMNLRERVALAVAGTLACVRRLEALTLKSDPHDASLQALLDGLATKTLNRAEHLERYQARMGSMEPCRLNRKEIALLIHSHFPSLVWRLGEGVIDRREGTYLAECLEDECSAFFRTLAEAADESGSRALFRGLAKADLSLMDFLRHALH